MSSPTSFANDVSIDERLQKIRDEAESMKTHFLQKFGDNDDRTLRIGEVCDSLQRVRWMLERHQADHFGPKG